jgi:hypothetical protein
MSKFVKQVQIVQIGSARYGPGKARQAACEYANNIAVMYHNNKGFRDFNDWHRVAFHRSLPIFEKMLGTVKNRTNPRTLIDLQYSNGNFTANEVLN